LTTIGLGGLETLSSTSGGAPNLFAPIFFASASSSDLGGALSLGGNIAPAGPKTPAPATSEALSSSSPLSGVHKQPARDEIDEHDGDGEDDKDTSAPADQQGKQEGQGDKSDGLPATQGSLSHSERHTKADKHGHHRKTATPHHHKQRAKDHEPLATSIDLTLLDVMKRQADPAVERAAAHQASASATRSLLDLMMLPAVAGVVGEGSRKARRKDGWKRDFLNGADLPPRAHEANRNLSFAAPEATVE
jgi:hypothetical protein